MNRAATSGRSASLEPDRRGSRFAPAVAFAVAAPGLCILALECSQLVHHGFTRPELVGSRARALLARAPGPTRTPRLPA